MKIFKFLIIPLMIVMLLGFGMNASAELHSKWSAGDLIFYDGTTNIWAIRNGTDGVKVYDDLNLTFGTDNDATIEFDDDGTGKLIITCSAGITLSGAIDFDSAFVSTSTTGFATTATFVPDAGRTHYAYSIGNRNAELTVDLDAAADQNFEPFQVNINLTASGGEPTGTSTVRLLRIRSTHDTVDMDNLRIMSINTYMDVQRNMEAAYGTMHGIDFTVNAVVLTTEAAVGAFNMECTSSVTGPVRGIVINMHGATLPSTSIGLEVRTDGGPATLGEGIRIWSVGANSITTGITLTGASVQYGINLNSAAQYGIKLGGKNVHGILMQWDYDTRHIDEGNHDNSWGLYMILNHGIDAAGSQLIGQINYVHKDAGAGHIVSAAEFEAVLVGAGDVANVIGATIVTHVTQTPTGGSAIIGNIWRHVGLYVFNHVSSTHEGDACIAINGDWNGGIGFIPNNLTNAFRFTSVAGCVDAETGDDQTYAGRITIDVAGQSRYLYYYD